MWTFLVLCILSFFVLVQEMYGSPSEDLAKTTQLCCEQAMAYARNHASGDEGCSSPIPPGVPSDHASLCIFVLDKCCKKYFQQLRDCDIGNDTPNSTNHCSGTGVAAEKVKGTDSKIYSSHGNNKPSSSPISSTETAVASLCEKYAPNELCAHHCIPVPGSYKCKCNPGFMLMADGRNCILKNRCEPFNPCQHECRDDGVEVTCSCRPGYQLTTDEKSCIDVNECATSQHNCITGFQNCANTIGSFNCIRYISCGTGYTMHPSTSQCEDIDECALGTHNCGRLGRGFQCVNRVGSFRCVRKRPSTTNTTAAPEHKYGCSEQKQPRQSDKLSSTDSTQPEKPKANASMLPEIEPKQPEITNRQNPKAFETASLIVNDEKGDERRTVKDERKENKPVLADFQKNESIKVDERTINCHIGFQMDKYGACLDIDECATNRHSCSVLTEACQNTMGGYVCDCAPGYHRLDYGACVTITPSSTTSTSSSPPPVNSTEQVDVGKKTATDTDKMKANKPVVFDNQDMPKNETIKIKERTSNCHIGFRIDENGVCLDIDECATNRHSCSVLTEACQNTMGGYVCDCAPGYHRLDYGACVTINPSSTTSTSSSPPPVNSTEQVDVGKETATDTNEMKANKPVVVNNQDMPKNETIKINERTINCHIGYRIDENGVCLDIDECESNRHSCSDLTEVCRNTMGGYVCYCAPGYHRHPNGACVTITISSTTSTSSPPPPVSSTEQGYYNIMRPASRPIRPRICDEGFHFNPKTRKCEDTNECTNGQADCASIEICVNTVGGYRCDCPLNWRLDLVRHRCFPINGQDEDQVFNGTGVDKEDTPIEEKQCPRGYKIGNENTCEDIDECSTGQGTACGSNVCTNLPGGYACSCPAGHKMVGDNLCEDIDECALDGNMTICSQNADCLNTVGSYKCKCHNGFRSAPMNDKVCVDVNECTESPAGSLCEHRCNNIWGGYRCSCHRGYRLNPDNSTCADIDECTEFKSRMPCFWKCLNEPGSYFCTCPAGYSLSEDKRSCIDIDECANGEAPCAKGNNFHSTSNICLNTRGRYHCHRIVCPSGYKLESSNRCTKIIMLCPIADQICAHQPTTYSYNFITFVSNLYIPTDKVDLFTMRGPAWPSVKIFTLKLVNVTASPTVEADISAFLMVHTGNQAIVSLVRSLQGPQNIELELSMEVYADNQLKGVAVARLLVYVSEYEF